MKVDKTLGTIRIPVFNEYRTKRISDITHCKADNQYTLLFFNTNESRMVSNGLSEMEQLIDNDNFFRCHKSSIVNINYVEELCCVRKLITLCNGKQITVSRRKSNELKLYLKKREKII